MLPTQPEDYISVLASNFLHPLTKLIEATDEFENKGPNEVQASGLENGFSLSIILLSVLLTESALSRMQYRMKKTPPERPLEFTKKNFKEEKLYDRLEELFVIRDVIAHNHIWEAKVYWDEKGDLRLIKAQLSTGYGDKKFNKVIDMKNQTTRILGLNVFPTRICLSDAKKVLKNVVEFLLVIEKKDPNYFRITNQWVKYKGQAVMFTKLVSDFVSLNG
jgi:hypothetical protein